MGIVSVPVVGQCFDAGTALEVQLPGRLELLNNLSSVCCLMAFTSFIIALCVLFSATAIAASANSIGTFNRQSRGGRRAFAKKSHEPCHQLSHHAKTRMGSRALRGSLLVRPSRTDRSWPGHVDRARLSLRRSCARLFLLTIQHGNSERHAAALRSDVPATSGLSPTIRRSSLASRSTTCRFSFSMSYLS